MNTPTTTEVQVANTPIVYPETIVEREVYYPVEIEGEMGETAIHYKLNSLLFNLLEAFFASRKDVLIGANLMIYYDEGNSKKWLAPDVFVCFAVENKLRRTFKTWEEGVFPQVVFEVASDSTFENDLGGKRLEYARLGVEEYYLLDPERQYLPSPLMAFRRENGLLLLVQVENNRVLSPLLNLEIVDTSKSFRLFNPQEQKFLQAILTGEE
ncbi:MAG: Uma2 family endonuclease [Pyrinomonadaceae bacterium]